MRNRFIWAVLVPIIVALGCADKAPELRIKTIGVFSESGGSFIAELDTYATQVTGDEYESLGRYNFPSAKTVVGFYVNMPDVVISESKMIWFESIPPSRLRESWGKVLRQPVIENVGNGIFKISSYELSSMPTGAVGLRLRMPLGSPDRIYLINLF